MDLINEYLLFENAFDYISPNSFIFSFLGLILVVVGKWVYQLFHTYNLDKELTRMDNKALGVAFAGYIVAIGWIIRGVFISGESEHDLLNDIFLSLFWGILSILLLNLSQLLNDKFILRNFSNRKEIIEDKNIGAGVVIAGSYIGSAIILSSVLSSPASDSFLWDMIDTFVYFFITQILFIFFSVIYQFITKYNIYREIEEDNIAAGVAYGINMIAIAIILSQPIQFTHSIAVFVLWFINGLILLFVSRFCVDKLLLPAHDLDNEISKDKNWTAALVEGGVALIIAFLISVSFSP